MFDTFLFDQSLFDQFTQETQVILFAIALETYLGNALSVPIWAVHIPETITEYPQLVYKLDKRQSYYTLQGPTRLVEVVYSIDAIGTDKQAVINLAEALRQSLQSYRGAFGGLTVTGARLGKRTYAYDPPSFGSDQGTHHVESEYTFNYQRI